jgi:uncharacterized protein YkwD
MDNHESKSYSLDRLQKTALSLMAILTLVTFVGANLQAILWQSSDWLVSTVLPATVINLTNQERSELNATPLQRNATLDAAATLKAKDMAQNEYFSHFSPAGVSPWYWFDQAGYVYAHAGENLAIHFTDSTEVVEAWMKSPMHRENIVNGKYTEIGVGTAKGTYEGYDTVYVVQLFGARGVPAVRVAPTVIEPPIFSPPVAPTVPTVPSPVISIPELAVVPEPVSPLLEPSPAEKVSEAPLVLAESESKDDSAVAEVTLLAPVAAPVSLAVEPEIVTSQEVLTNGDLTDSPTQPAVSSHQEIVIIESPLISTSSGLVVANITTDNPSHTGATAIASFATKPNALLQFVYLGLGALVFLLLTASLVLEARQLRFVQVAYSVMLLCGMGGLWFLNSLLTSGAVII